MSCSISQSMQQDVEGKSKQLAAGAHREPSSTRVPVPPCITALGCGRREGAVGLWVVEIPGGTPTPPAPPGGRGEMERREGKGPEG